jgi:glycosyltransferase involved in cell wall biosynthesis
MKIIVLGSKGMPVAERAGGIERGVDETASRLAAQGHEVIVYERGRSFGLRHERGVTVRSVPFLDSKNLAGWSHAAVSLADSLVHFRDAEIYHIHRAANGFLCPLARLLTRARVIFHLHGAEWRSDKWGPMIKRLVWASCVMGAFAAHQIATVCTQCSGMLGLVPFSPRKTALVPNGVPQVNGAAPLNGATQATNGLDPESPFILFVGRLAPEKRIDLLIEAFKSIESRARLLIVGPSSHCDRYEARLHDLARGDRRIVFAGPADFDRVRELYRKCLAVVLPSQHEGCSNVLLEALAYGCCIVTSDIPANRDVVQDAALFFKSGDADSLADALCEVLRDEAAVGRARSAAQIRSRTMWDWDAVTREFLQLYAASAPAQNGIAP